MRRLALVLSLSLLLHTPCAWAQAPAIQPPRLGGYIQARESYTEGTGLTATINRARLSADGALPTRFSYRLLIEFEAGATARSLGVVALREAYVRWTSAPWSIQAGQFKTPFSREYLIPVPLLETPEFSAVVESLATKYDIGLMGEYTIPLVALSAGVFNGEGQNAGLNRDSTVLLVARAAVRPVPQATVAGNVARMGSDSLRYGGDLTLEQSGVLVRGEYLAQQRDGRPRDDWGWYVLATVRVTPWLQLVGKQEDFQRPSVGLSRRASGTTAGTIFELPGGRTRLVAYGIQRITGYPRVTRNGAIFQAQVRF